MWIQGAMESFISRTVVEFNVFNNTGLADSETISVKGDHPPYQPPALSTTLLINYPPTTTLLVNSVMTYLPTLSFPTTDPLLTLPSLQSSHRCPSYGKRHSLQYLRRSTERHAVLPQRQLQRSVRKLLFVFGRDTH